MPADMTCPDPTLLEQLLLGRLYGEEAESMEAHVAGCPRCVQGPAGLAGSDPLLSAVRAAGGEPDACPDVVLVLMRRLKKLGLQETITHAGHSTPPLPAPADFLDAPRQPDEIGSLGPYRVLLQLGAGGMGVVYLADDPRLKRQVALKVIRPELLARGDLRERFLREAQTIAHVEHENIVAIHDVGEHRGVPYLVMPLLRGESLEERLRRVKGPLPLDEALRIGREIAAGLAAAHERGLIHRDVKPGNVYLAAQAGGGDRVKVLDFGLARAAADDEELQPGAIVGTPAFMAPEQAAGRPVDARADLFSLGCVLYRLATGKQAFTGTDMFTLLMQIATEEPPAPAEVNPALPAAVSRLIVRLLAKNPDDRPASAAEVVEAIKKIERDRQSRINRRRLLLAGGAVLTGAAGTVAWALTRPAPPPVVVEEPPADVTLELDGPPARLLLTHLGERTTIDVAGRLTLSLPPGDYELGVADPKVKQRPYPPRFIVRPGVAMSVQVRLVGEVCHNDYPRDLLAVACSPVEGDTRVLGAGGTLGDGVMVWDGATTGKPPPWFTGHSVNRVLAVAFAPDGRTAASGGGRKGRGGDVALWDVQTRQVIPELPKEQDSQVQALAFSPDGTRLAWGCNDGNTYVWDRKSRNISVSLTGAHDGSGILAVAFTPDGQRLLTAGVGGKVFLWDLAPGRKPVPLAGHKDEVRSVAATDAFALTAGADGTVRSWELNTRQGGILCQHEGEVAQAVFTKDRRHVLWCGARGALRLHYFRRRDNEVYRFDGSRGFVRGVACTADGRRAVSCDQEGVRVWALPL